MVSSLDDAGKTIIESFSYLSVNKALHRNVQIHLACILQLFWLDVNVLQVFLEAYLQ